MLSQFKIQFSRINLTAKFHTVHVHQYSKYGLAKMANMIDLESKRKLSNYSNFRTRSLKVLELMKRIVGLVPINSVNIEHSIMRASWPRSNIISDADFTVNCPFGPCTLSKNNVKPTGLLQLFFDHPTLTWEHVNNMPSRPLTNITKRPQYAVTRNFAYSIQTDIDLSHDLSPLWFLSSKKIPVV